LECLRSGRAGGQASVEVASTDTRIAAAKKSRDWQDMTQAASDSCIKSSTVADRPSGLRPEHSHKNQANVTARHGTPTASFNSPAQAQGVPAVIQTTPGKRGSESPGYIIGEAAFRTFESDLSGDVGQLVRYTNSKGAGLNGSRNPFLHWGFRRQEVSANVVE
jgi:hypothetical protein